MSKNIENLEHIELPGEWSDWKNAQTEVEANYIRCLVAAAIGTSTTLVSMGIDAMTQIHIDPTASVIIFAETVRQGVITVGKFRKADRARPPKK